MALSFRQKSKGAEPATINQVSEMRSSGLLMSRSIKASLPRGKMGIALQLLLRIQEPINQSLLKTRNSNKKNITNIAGIEKVE